MSKIILLNHGLHIAGVSRALVNLANALVERGHDVTIKIEINDFTLEPQLDSRVKRQLFLPEWRIFGRRIPGFLRFYELFLKYLYKIPTGLLHRLVVGKGYDAVIGFNRGAAARIAAAGKYTRKLVWVHSDYLRCGNGLAGFASLGEAQAAYGKFDRIVCVSRQAESSFRAAIGDYDTILVRDNIVDLDIIRKKAREAAPEKQGKVLCAVGRICEAKNYPMLLQACDILNKKGLSFTLWIVGGGAEMEDLSALKERMGLTNVVLWGPQGNPYPYMMAADGYVCSSIYEGLSTTTIEALALGKPCVVTDCVGMRDILGDSAYGLIVPIEAAALAEGMERLLTDDAFAAHYGAKAAERAAYYAPERCIREIEELLV